MWSLFIEMRPMFHPDSLVSYPLFMAAGASFGYWMENIHQRQTQQLQERRASLLLKRQMKAAREAERAKEAEAAA